MAFKARMAVRSVLESFSFMDDQMPRTPSPEADVKSGLSSVIVEPQETPGRTETEVMQMVAHSLEERFEAEAMPHIHDIFRTAVRVLGDRSRAEDVAQDVFLQAWKSFERFETGTNCRAWLFKILFHCINHSRRKWFRFPLLKQTEEFIETNLTYLPPVPEHLTDEELIAALDRIPSDYRAVVLLVDVEEFAYKEAAEILQIPIGTVMSRLSRGRRQLREHLVSAARSYGISAVSQEGQSA